jgi:transposase
MFIEKHSACGITPFEKYAKGIKEDYDAVKYAILNRDINNSMIEGFNDKIKLLRKIRFGRAGAELINAVSVLSTQPRFCFVSFESVKYKTSAEIV